MRLMCVDVSRLRWRRTGSSRPTVADGIVPGHAALLKPIHRAYSLADTLLGRLGFVSADERAALARVPVSVKTIPAGGELIREGSTTESIYFMATGWAYRYRSTRGGARQVTVLLVPGGVCNVDNLMFHRADFGVRTLTGATVLALPRHAALSLAAEHAGVGRAFTWLALAENAILSQWAVGLGRRNAQQRLAHFLCEMHLRLGEKGSFKLPLTQELIADTLGLTSVHINRTMRYLRLQGLVSISGRTITILDRDGLCMLAEFDPSYLEQIKNSAAADATRSDPGDRQ
jgi:CRP-like cAMP-binding protein